MREYTSLQQGGLTRRRRGVIAVAAFYNDRVIGSSYITYRF